MSKIVINKHLPYAGGAAFDANDLQFGEIGINYISGYESLSIKNTNNDIVTVGMNSIFYNVTSALNNSGNGTIDYNLTLSEPPQFLSLYINTNVGNVITPIARNIYLIINGTRFGVFTERRFQSGTFTSFNAKAPWMKGIFVNLVKENTSYKIIGNPIVYQDESTNGYITSGKRAFNYVFRRYANCWQEYFGQSYNYPSSIFAIPIPFEDTSRMFMTATLYGKSSKNTCIDTYTTDEVSVDFAYEQGGEAKCGGLYVCGYAAQ